MEAKELRIGNWVQYPMGGNCKIESGHEIDLVNQSFPCPISLTPEILEKAGFERNEYNAFTLIDKWVGEDGFALRLQLEKGKSTFFLVGNGGYDESGQMDITNTCKYVHQLQNLFYFLSGEELNIAL